MQIIKNPEREKWKELLRRPYQDNSKVLQTVQDILAKVQDEKDSALKALTKTLDGFDVEQFKLSATEIAEAEKQLSDSLKAAINQAKNNIETFHKAQAGEVDKIETVAGIKCWRKSVGIEKVGLYIPGGTAPLFSTVLMLGIPAVLAGCEEIILCTPCNKEGNIHPAIIYAAQLVGIKDIYKVGGAQAIAAMAYGTETIPAVYKIFGPGNQYVTAAKQLVQIQGIAIDMPAGPSEVCVLADESANPSFIAADLLSQAEHGADSQVILVSTSEDLVHECIKEIDRQIILLPRKAIALKALANSKAFFINNVADCIDMVNQYAAEHLIINCKEANDIAEQVKNAGSVFIGSYSPESAGDYASGTNHTLPTNGYAKAYSGVSLDSFVKKITFQQLTKKGLENIASTVVQMAEAEGLHAHANAIRIRMEKE